jgi:hypothetical protein
MTLRPSHRWEVDFKEIGCDDDDQFKLAQDGMQWLALVMTLMNF